MPIWRGRTYVISEITVDDDVDFLTLYKLLRLAAPASGGALRKGSQDIANAEIADAAAIAYAKLNLTNKVKNADILAATGIAYSKLNLVGLVRNADIKSDAAILRSKLNFGDGLVNADIKSDAAILRSKLNFGDGLVNADIADAAAIAESKLNITHPTGTKEFFVPVSFGTQAVSAYGDTYPKVSMGDVPDKAYMMFKAPHNFNSIVSAVVVVAFTGDATDNNWDISSSYCAIDEQYNTHTESDTATLYSATLEDFYGIDISGILTNLSADDYVGIRVVLEDAGQGGVVFGLRFRYS